MVQEYPLRQLGEDGVNEASSSAPKNSLSSPAEIQVREIASKIGILEDSEILEAVCQRMRSEYVVQEWQLSVLDSRQWEKLNAPIGLAVAVKYISTTREHDVQLQQKYSSESRTILHAEEKQEDSDEFMEQTTFCEKDSFSSSLLGSSKPEEARNEIQAESNTQSDDDPVAGSKEDHDLLEDESKKASIAPSETTTDTEPKDEQIETEKVAQPSEEDIERNPQILDSNDTQKKDRFGEACKNLSKSTLPVLKDEDEPISREEEFKSNSESPMAVPKIDSKDDVEDINADQKDRSKGVDSMMNPASSFQKHELVQANIEINPLKSEAPASSVLDGTKEEREQSGKTSSSEIKQKITATIEENNEPSQAETESLTLTAVFEENNEPSQTEIESFHVVEEESSPLSADVEREQQKIKLETKSIESKEGEAVLETKSDGLSTIKNGNKDGTDNEIEILFEVTEEELKLEMEEGDSKLEDTTNIFCGIPNCASYSSDDDGLLGYEEGDLCKLAESDEEDTSECEEDTPIYMNSNENNRLHPDNCDDDITVAHSNVSPECKKSASKRKNKIKHYPHEYNKKREVVSFEIDTKPLSAILAKLPDEEHRSILSQLLIMTNARDRNSRTNLAFQVQDTLLALVEKHKIDDEPTKAVEIIFHLSRLKRTYRIIFGKSLFMAMSKLYKRSEKKKERRKSSKKKGGKTVVDLNNLVDDTEEIQKTGLKENNKNRTGGLQLES